MNPLKQGLKQATTVSISQYSDVKEVNPLKQGLKRSRIYHQMACCGIVKEVNPLKQGLKHHFVI